MFEIINGLVIGSGFLGLLYFIPYLLRRGWGDAENKTKRVCDVCFRDIKKWNKTVKDFEEGTTPKVKEGM